MRTSRLALLQLDDLALIPDALALVGLRLSLSAHGGGKVSDDGLVAAGNGDGGVLLDLSCVCLCLRVLLL